MPALVRFTMRRVTRSRHRETVMESAAARIWEIERKMRTVMDTRPRCRCCCTPMDELRRELVAGVRREMQSAPGQPYAKQSPDGSLHELVAHICPKCGYRLTVEEYFPDGKPEEPPEQVPAPDQKVPGTDVSNGADAI